MAVPLEEGSRGAYTVEPEPEPEPEVAGAQQP